MSALTVSADQIRETIDHLRRLSAGVREAVLLWLASRANGNAVVHTVFVPLQHTGFDYFTIPPEGIHQVLARCRSGGFVAAQLHTHPHEAFHSEADDDLALIRHKNALSFVFPNFAADAQPNSFSAAAHLFRLLETNMWEFIPPHRHALYYRIV